MPPRRRPCARTCPGSLPALDQAWAEDLGDDLDWLVGATAGVVLPRGQVGEPAPLRSERYLSVLERLVSAARTPRLTVEGGEPTVQVLARLLESATRRLREVADPLRPDSTDAAWQQVREAVARLHGLATVAAAVLPEESAAALALLRKPAPLLAAVRLGPPPTVPDLADRSAGGGVRGGPRLRTGAAARPADAAGLRGPLGQDGPEGRRVSAPAGVFVVFEGGDGVGKSTQVGLLAQRVAASGREVVTTFEPGATRLGAVLRGVLLHGDAGDVGPRAEALLYAADKAEHLHEVVRPALARGAVVLCDRYVDSMVAYQGAGRVLAEDEVERVARWATDDLRPDLTVLLDLDPAEGLGGVAEPDRLESAGLAFHDRARSFFLALAERDPDRYLVLPARHRREELAATIAARVDALLSSHGAGVSAGAGTLPG